MPIDEFDGRWIQNDGAIVTIITTKSLVLKKQNHNINSPNASLLNCPVMFVRSKRR